MDILQRWGWYNSLKKIGAYGRPEMEITKNKNP
jgi:hypothetical protein